jgi:transposase
MSRKMQQFIVKGKEVFVGLEDSKRTWKLSVRSGGREIHYTSMAAKYADLHSYLQSKYPECEITVIYEAGFKGFGLYDKLSEDGIKCIVTPPNKVTQEKHSRVKTDKVDSRRLATVLENGDFKACAVPDKQRREERQVARLLTSVQKEITRAKNRIRKLFDCHGYAEVYPAGKWTESDYAVARKAEVSEPLRVVVDTYYKMVDDLKQMRRDLLKKVMDYGKQERYARAVEVISSVAGVGRLTAIRLVLEWGEDLGERFRSGKSLACFSGLTQSEYSTAESIRRGRITGQSRGCIRAWLIQCAWVAIRKDPAMLTAFDQLVKNTASKKKAIVAIARKLVVRMWTCVHKNEPYVIGVVE